MSSNFFVKSTNIGKLSVCSFSLHNGCHVDLFSDAVAVTAAALYALSLLAVSYWLATPPTSAALRSTVDKHAAFQYLWTLTFVDFLLGRRVVASRASVLQLFTLAFARLEVAVCTN